MIEPSVEWFPDAWVPDQDGVHRLVRRVMTHVGLGDVPVSIRRFLAVTEDEDDVEDFANHRVLAYFEGIHDGVARFGVNCSQIYDPEHLIGVLAHEVAHAYRHLRGLVVDDRQEEEELTDLTTVFFGFGLLTVNNARGEFIAGETHTVRRAGYLSDYAMSYALACWVAARGVEGEAALAERWLHKDQEAAFRRYLGTVSPDDLRKRIGVEGALQVMPRPVERLLDAPAAPSDAEPIDFGERRGRIFRVRSRPTLLGLALGALGGGIFGIRESPELPTILAWLVVGAVVGLLGARLRTFDECSECEVRIPARAARCLRCGSVVVGVIRDRSERAEAAEKLRQERIAARRAKRTP